MEYLNRWELRGLKKGRQEGVVGFFLELAEDRFGPLPGWVLQKISGADESRIKEWGKLLITKNSLEEVFSS